MDNCSVHDVQGVKDIFEVTGILFLYLPPDYNPIEELFIIQNHDEIIQATSQLY